MNLKLLITICVFYGLNISGAISQNQMDQPNIIFILADDLGYNDLSCYGQTAYETPRLDQMAKNGMKFTDFYSAPNCSPSRAALLTGCYPVRVGMPSVVAPKGPEWTLKVYNKGLNPEEETIAELLKKQGYQTACIGKWHLGHHEAHLPTRQGFDEYFGLPYSNDMLAYKGYGALPLMENEEVLEYEPDQSLLTKRYTEKALSFIDRNEHQPFFLYLAHSMPHVPLFRSKEFESSTEGGVYGDVINELDWSVGAILDKLDSLGLAENTIVFFTSDNGPWLVYGNHGGKATPLREGKHTTFEGGMRVPFIAHWPGRIKKNSECKAIAGLIDILPTISKVTHSDLPKRKIDGKDISGLLLDTGEKGRNIQIYGKENVEAVRKDQWKLHFPHAYVHILKPGKDGEKGEQVNKQIDFALYNLEDDPMESNNLIEKYPEIAGELKEIGQQYMKEFEQEKRPPGIAKEE
ncbi:sulfatase family protein [Flexithrix dorotheae]|uniref:sulfatase family protein n=1 Tax=Flexithrix dorotheae TaxID=70993 RepID=UPI0003611B48|nr:sulfatase [Flexithrix dorotheae]